MAAVMVSCLAELLAVWMVGGMVATMVVLKAESRAAQWAVLSVG